MRTLRGCLVASVLVLLASLPLVALPLAAAAKAKTKDKAAPESTTESESASKAKTAPESTLKSRSTSTRPGARSLRPKTTRVLIETDGPEVVLEASASGAPADTTDDANQPAGASSQPSVAENASQNPGGTADDGESETAEVPLPLDEGKWDAVCSVPCERRLPRAALFRITGAGLTTSATFSLPPKRPSVTLDVKTGSARWYWTGVIASVLGGSFLVGGVAPPLLLGGSFSTSGKVLGGTGAVLLGAGLPLWLLNRTTVAIF